MDGELMKYIFDYDPDTKEHWCYEKSNPDIIISGVVAGEKVILDNANGTVCEYGVEDVDIES